MSDFKTWPHGQTLFCLNAKSVILKNFKLKELLRKIHSWSNDDWTHDTNEHNMVVENTESVLIKTKKMSSLQLNFKNRFGRCKYLPNATKSQCDQMCSSMRTVSNFCLHISVTIDVENHHRMRSKYCILIHMHNFTNFTNQNNSVDCQMFQCICFSILPGCSFITLGCATKTLFNCGKLTFNWCAIEMMACSCNATKHSDGCRTGADGWY